MKTTFPLLPLALLALALPSHAQDAVGAQTTLERPLSAEQFDAEIRAITEQYGTDYDGLQKAIAQKEAAWREQVAAWNEANPGEAIVIEDDEPDEDRADAVNLDDPQSQEARDDTLEAWKTWDGEEEYEPGEVGEGKGADSGAAFAQAAAAMGADGESDGLDDMIDGAVKVSSLLGASGIDYLTVGGLNPDGTSLAGLFPAVIENLPFVNATDEERRKLVGYTDTVTNFQTVYHSKSIAAFMRSHPDWEWVDGSNAGKTNWAKFRKISKVEHEGTLNDTDVPETGWDWAGIQEIPEGYHDEMAFDALQWDFGGVAGDKALWGGNAENGPVIGDLKFSRDGLRFQYENDLSSWGMGYDDAEAIACLFVKDNDGNWIGGKFDWISSSRTTRDFKNVFSGYNGWDLSNVPTTTEAAFVIISKDGKWRSNVATAQWER